MNDEDISILVLTEDSGAGGEATIAMLVAAMLRSVEPDANIGAIEMEPTTQASARRALRGNYWKAETQDAEMYRVDLVRTIATKLAEGDTSFVVFHFDGDRTWKERKQSENPKKFDRLMDVRIRRILTQLYKNNKNQVDAAMQRLLLVVPFYSIESWLFQNTDEGKRLCLEKHGGKDADKFEEWASNRKALDEVHKPKEAVCFRDKYNATLAEQNFPFEQAHKVGKSLKHAISTLKACKDLKKALKSLSPKTSP